MIRVVIFDLAGTYITHLNPHVVHAAASYYSIEDNKISFTAFHRYLNELLDVWFRGSITETQYWRTVEEHFGFPHGKVRKFWTELYLKKTRVDPVLRRFAERLKQDGYTLGVISNTARSHVLDNRKAKRLLPFDFFVFSNEVGVVKPHSRIYRIALRKAKAKASECIFIDDVKSYLAPARKLGMHTVLHTDSKKTVAHVKTILKKYS